jgi:hypothetical protein
MKNLARLILVVLVALAVPVQGALAVTAGQCMALAKQSAGGHENRSHGQDGHHHAASSHSHADEGGSNAVDDEGAADGAHCGPCTACCASASIAGSGALSILSTASNAPYVFSQFPPIGVQPDGVDRPPLAL